ncbi:MAG: histidine kinase [Bacteroidetes bacterium]|nr:histidine kinase [Bacteroidota bacterium]
MTKTPEQETASLRRREYSVVALLLLLYFVTAIFGRGTFWDSYQPVHLGLMIILFPAVALFHTYLLVPLLQRRRWVRYGLSLPLLLLVPEALRVLVLRTPASSLFDAENLVIPYLLGIIVSWLFVAGRDWIVHARMVRTLKEEAMRAELAFLKAQIAPHFLFNTLNTMYALALNERAERTAESIVMLSDLMRYNLQDAQASEVSANIEADYLKRYIALQTLRFGENNRIDASITVPDDSSLIPSIAPLLLLPFVENVFTHGMSTSQRTQSRISLRVTDRDVELMTENDIPAEQPAVLSHGVGTANVRKRLALLYPGRHELRCGPNNGRYHMFLHITLRP